MHLGLGYQPHRPAHGGIAADPGRPDLDDAVIVEGTGQHRIALFSRAGNGLAGDGGLIHRGHAAGDDAVHRDALAGPNQDPVVDADR